MEIVSKGDIYGAVPVSALGRMEIGKRNAFLVDILEAIHKTENRNSGILTMRTECRKRNLPEPIFYCVHGEFKVVFKNSQPADNVVFDRSRPEKSILDYCELPRSRDELAAFTGLNQSYVMTTWVRPLVREGRLLRTEPHSPKSPFQRFVRA
jgi:ATP-dependent DNA helicase RecG